jgi:hypothetical protein
MVEAGVNQLNETLHAHKEVGDMFFDWSYEAVGMASSASTIAWIEAAANAGSSSQLWYTVSRRKYDHGGILGRFASSGGDDE